jgi:nucleotide-binding universal stress UspA family protein
MYATILIALDGSPHSLVGGDIALTLARRLGATIVIVHVYDAGLHSMRFSEMEPVLPKSYSDPSVLDRVRDAHDGLIHDGFESLSRGYMDAFLPKVEASGLSVRKIHRKGRNYIELLRVADEIHADLIVLGATGLGALRDSFPGSTAKRVLRMAHCDVLLARKAPLDGGAVTVGIDGSSESLSALKKGATWAKAFSRPLHMAAAYDPHFHNQVFGAMAKALSPERKEEVGLETQKALHGQIIDDGLAQLYRSFLDQAVEICQALSVKQESSLLEGKAYDALLAKADKDPADLIVLGRFGHHRRDEAQLGSNTEAVAQLAHCNVLVTSPTKFGVISGRPAKDKLLWNKEALHRLHHVPSSVRPMARQSVESFVESQGRSEVTLEDFTHVARQFGMIDSGEEDNGRPH